METTNKLIPVTEYQSFDEAFNAAINTKESFAAFQTGNKLKIMKEGAKRFFVDNNAELWYTHEATDGIRILHKARVHSMISSGPFQYVQLMVLHGVGNLRMSDQYVDRAQGIKISKQGEVFSFMK